MREALLQIKQDLGEEAIILKTRKLPRKIFALNSQEEIEVTAAVDETVMTAEPPPLRYSSTGIYGRTGTPVPRTPEKPDFGRSVDSPSKPAVSVRSLPESQHPEPAMRFQYMEIKDDLRELKELIRSVLEAGDTAAAGEFAGGWAVLYKRLVDSEVLPDIAAHLIQDMQKKNATLISTNEKELVAILEGYFPVSGPIRLPADRAYVVAFVGPTGAGKTTTLAKLAAHLAVNKQKAVSLLTADTYRIAAIDQIRAFADIVNIGLQVVFDPAEVAQALAGCANDDIVFVDTAGRSRTNAEHMRELEVFLAALKPDEIHLVLSASTKDSDLRQTVERFRGLGINRLLFTKVDETASLGNVFNTVTTCGIPVSYFATGQSIPDDIELAQPGRFVQRLWERKGP